MIKIKHIEATITVTPTREWTALDPIMQDPELYERTRFDGSTPLEESTLKHLAGNMEHQLLEVRRNGKLCGYFAVIHKGIGIYEVHTALLPECRGKDAIRAGRLGRDWMFLNTPCRLLTSLCPDWLPESVVFAQFVGFHVDFHRAALWKRDGYAAGAKFVTMGVAEWARVARDQFRPLGETFHEKLFTQLEHESHPEDPVHDAMVGLAWRMMLNGQPFKAQAIYNDWALTAGYVPLLLQGQFHGGYVVDIRTALVLLDAAGNVTLLKKGTQ